MIGIFIAVYLFVILPHPMQSPRRDEGFPLNFGGGNGRGIEIPPMALIATVGRLNRRFEVLHRLFDGLLDRRIRRRWLLLRGMVRPQRLLTGVLTGDTHRVGIHRAVVVDTVTVAVAVAVAVAEVQLLAALRALHRRCHRQRHVGILCRDNVVLSRHRTQSLRRCFKQLNVHHGLNTGQVPMRRRRIRRLMLFGGGGCVCMVPMTVTVTVTVTVPGT